MSEPLRADKGVDEVEEDAGRHGGRERGIEHGQSRSQAKV
jgi:hypothetical protein